jgi:hypothetical protein
MLDATEFKTYKFQQWSSKGNRQLHRKQLGSRLSLLHGHGETGKAGGESQPGTTFLGLAERLLLASQVRVQRLTGNVGIHPG